MIMRLTQPMDKIFAMIFVISGIICLGISMIGPFDPFLNWKLYVGGASFLGVACLIMGDME